MFPFTRFAALCALPCACAALLAGCGQSLESNPTFQEHVARVEKIEESLNDTKNRLVLMNNEFQTVSKDVNTLVAAGPANGGEEVKALEGRIAGLETSLKSMNENLASLNGKLANAGARSARLVASRPSDDADVAAANAPDSGASTDASAHPATAHATAGRAKPAHGAAVMAVHRRATGRVSEVAIVSNTHAAGRYHMIAPGETIEKIATLYRIKPQQILTANRLPSGRRLLAGQQIYVPAS